MGGREHDGSGLHGVAGTAHASRYLQQLCKHWSHKIDVAFDASAGTIAFDTGVVATLHASGDALSVDLRGGDEEALRRMTKTLEDHLNRFAFREGPLPFSWHPSPA